MTLITTTESILVPSGTVATAKGDGAAVDVSAAGNRVFLVTLAITKIIEQESLDVSIFGSADGVTWDAKAIVQPSDLRGRVVDGSNNGSPLDFLLKETVRVGGLTPADVRIGERPRRKS